MYKINFFNYEENDIITTDRYLEFCIENDICYIKTDFFYTGPLYWRGEHHPKKINDVCVTGHSDYPIVEQISNNFKYIFCINKLSNAINTFGLPLGLTNDTDESEMHRIYGNKEIVVDTFKKSFQKEYLCYLNFNISTYPNERKQVYDIFKNENWTKVGNIVNTISGRTNYLEEIKKSKFVLCPRGNGVDTHRLWESLYMGSIPIVRYEITHELFRDLPISFINDWSEIKQEYLEDKYLEFVDKEWNFEKLKIGYWEKFIKENINK